MIKKIETKEDAAAFLDGIEPGKPFCFESRGESIEIGPEVGSIFKWHKITKHGENALYKKTDAISMVYDWKDDINLCFGKPEQKKITGEDCLKCKYFDGRALCTSCRKVNHEN